MISEAACWIKNNSKMSFHIEKKLITSSTEIKKNVIHTNQCDAFEATNAEDFRA